MTLNTLIQVFSTALEIPPEQVVDELGYNTIPTWDSTAHMILIAELENAFGIMLDTDDIIDMSSVGKVKEILLKYGIDCR